MSHIGEYSTLQNDGGNQEHDSDVEECCSFPRVFVSAANNTEAMCEHASPDPAMQVQWVHSIAPFALIAIHSFSGGDDKLCECLTVAVNK